ncbi:MAG: TatD family hydrolase [bacterium]|nr:TatD family hydrolase [bacterium]
MFIDTHIHLDEFKDLEEVLDRARGVGVDGFICVGYDVQSSKFSYSLSIQYNDIYAILGIHPHSASEVTNEFLNWICNVKDNRKILGIGEIGLDYYRNLSPKEIQLEAFEKQLSLAQELKLPVSLHIRDGYKDAFNILKKYKVNGVFHCYSGGLHFLEEALSLDFFIGFDGPVTFHNARELIEVVRRCPLDRILLETDAPYLAPEPYRGRRNEPAYLIYIAEKIAEIKGIDLEELSKITIENTKICFPRYAT